MEKNTNRWDFQIELVKTAGWVLRVGVRTAGRVVMFGMTLTLIPNDLLIEPGKLLSLALAT